MASKPKPNLDERFSLHPHKAEDVLRTLLRTKPHRKQTESTQDDNKEPTKP
jgi:hypothetical protein